MKKKFIAKRKKSINYKFFLFVIVFILSLYIGYKYLDNSNKKIDDKELVSILFKDSNHHYKNNLINKILNSIKIEKPDSILNSNYKKLVNVNYINKKKVIKNDPVIYIYNTHQTEEYMPSSYAEYSVRPTVQMVNYILEEKFNNGNYKTIVEERKIKDILNMHKWNYSYSYRASRVFMEDSKRNNDSLKYFIDVHRDSVSKKHTTITINNKNYAKILFIVGLENRNYKYNLDFTNKINSILNNKYPNLSRGVYKKSGRGVNGIYNQDFSPNTILVEIGGKDNTVEEVLNTSLVFAECFMEAINNE